jgi:hypothetical protein
MEETDVERHRLVSIRVLSIGLAALGLCPHFAAGDAIRYSLADLGGAVAGDSPSFAGEINNNGQVFVSSGGSGQASRSFLYRNGQVTSFDGFTGPVPYLNDLGQLSGRAINNVGQTAYLAPGDGPGLNAFIEGSGGRTRIDSDGVYFEPRAINDQGQVAGNGAPAGATVLHPYYLGM